MENIEDNECECGTTYYPGDAFMCYNCEKLLCGQCFMIQENPYESGCVCFDCVIAKLKESVKERTILNEFKYFTTMIKEFNRKAKIIGERNKEIKELKEENEQLKKENEKLKKEIKYQPGGEGFKEAKEHFESLIRKNVK